MEPLPLLSPTKVRIVRQLVARDRTATDIASSLEIQVSAARKHLERLKAGGLVVDRFERAPRGRPKKMYRLTEAGRELLPRRYDAVLNAIVQAIRAERGADEAENFLKRVARDLLDAMRPAGARREGPQAALTALEALGFDPAIKRRPDGLEVTSRNCPLLRVATAQGEVVCRGLHEGILRASLGGPIRRGTWIVDGDPVCTHLIKVPRTET